MAVYVHHSKNGPDFEWDDAKIAGLLADVRFRQGRLLGLVEGMGAEFQAEAAERVRAFDREIFEGSAGKEYTGKELAGKEFAQLLPEIARDFAAPLTPERILKWASSAAAAPKGSVHFQVSITGGTESRLAKLIHWINSGAKFDPVLKAAVAHLWVVLAVSKDADSERLADIVTELLIARANQGGPRLYSVTGQLQAERHGYDEQIKLLRKMSLDVAPKVPLDAVPKAPMDATSWIAWFLGCVGRAIDNAANRMNELLEKKRFWDRCAGMGLNDRQRVVLEKLLCEKESRLTSSQWASLTKTSQDTAGRDINDLVQRGVLTRLAGGGRSTSYAISLGD